MHQAPGNSSDGLPEPSNDAGHMAARRRTEDRARRQLVERQRRERMAGRATAEPSTPVDPPARAPSDGTARRPAVTSCAWCGVAITPRSRGPIPKWCAAGCRRRAWEQSRAAASGRSAVQVVERPVEVRVPMTPTRRDWAPLLAELTRQLEDGRVYDRDLAGIGPALRSAYDAYNRRPHVRDLSRGTAFVPWG